MAVPPSPPPSFRSKCNGDSGAGTTFVYGVYSTWCRIECWTCWSSGWLCDWHCWGCRSSRDGSTAKAIRWDDFDSYFCRGVGIVWTYCCASVEYEGWWCDCIYHPLSICLTIVSVILDGRIFVRTRDC